MSVHEVIHKKTEERRLAKIIKKDKLPKDKFLNIVEDLGRYMKLVTFH